MPTITRRKLLASAALAPVVGSLAASEPGSPRRGATISPREKLRELHFPNVPLTTHEGKQVHFYDDLLKDKIATINFMYTRCKDACPLTTPHLVKVQNLLGDRVGRDIFMYSLTIDPKHDTAAVLRSFAEEFHTGPGWLLLTAQDDDLELLRCNIGFMDPDPEVGE